LPLNVRSTRPKLNQKLAAIDAESDQKLAEVQKAKDGPIDEAGCFDQWIDKVERIEKQPEDVDDNIRITYRLLDDHRTGLGQHLTRLGDVVDVEVAEEAAPASEEVVDRAESVDRTEIGAALTEPTGASAVAERPSPVSLQIKGGTPIQSAAPAPAVLPRSSTPTEQQ
jgi:hypothetical protein